MPSNHLILCCPFSSCLQCFPPCRSFPVSQFFSTGGQNIGASVSASDLPMNTQGWFSLGLTGLISLQSKELSGVFSSTTVFSSTSFTVFSLAQAVFSCTTVQKHRFFGAQLSLESSSHVHTWLLEKPYLWLSEYIEDWIWVVPGRGVSMINPEKLERWSWPR